MILDFSFKDVMNLSNIKRWGIIDMSREQSVAEHSYNVTMIALNIVRRMDFDDDNQELEHKVLHWALVHDLPEIASGDIPTPMKSYLKTAIDEMEKQTFPMWSDKKDSIEGSLAGKIVKLADLVDATQFAQKYCIDPRKDKIILEMDMKMAKVCKEIKQVYEIGLDEIIQSFMG